MLFLAGIDFYVYFVAISYMGWHGGALASTVASQQGDPRLSFESGLCVWSLLVLLLPEWVLFGYSGVFPQPKDKLG